MSMEEALKHVYSVNIPPVEEFHANTIRELYENVINLNRLDHDTVLQWWKMLHEYTMDNGALRIFVRKCEKDQRRGFVSCFDDGLSYVFCDNSFAKVIYGLAKEPYQPRDVADFTAAVNSLRFKCLHSSHGDERDAVDPRGNRYCVYKNGAMPNFHREWKLAHIIGVNQFYLGNYADFQNMYFQPGRLDDWSYDSRYGFIVRNMARLRNKDDRGLFISHFLRFSNPMNYFLIPQNHHIDMQGFARDISEDVNLLEYMRQLRLEEFGDAWREFEECASFSGFGDIANKARLGSIRIGFSCRPVAATNREVVRNNATRVNTVVGNRSRHRRWDVIFNGQLIVEAQSMNVVAFHAVETCARSWQLDFAGLRQIFPRIRGVETIKRREDVPEANNKYSKHSVQLSNGTEIVVVSTQWCGQGPSENWMAFQSQCQAVGLEIRETE